MLATAAAFHGLAVHAAARVSTLAGPNEVLVSALTRDPLDGSGLMFEERGAQRAHGCSPGLRARAYTPVGLAAFSVA
jgi:class 3 adenylate cyclase